MACCTIFNPEVWGTVSDWFMVTITALTGYGVYKTLKSQSKTLKLQAKTFQLQQVINENERIRLKKEIQPFFGLGIVSHSSSTKTNNRILLDIFLTNRGDFEAMDVIIDFQETPYPRENINFKLLGTLPLKHKLICKNGIINFAMECNTPIKDEDEFDVLYSLLMHIDYSDLKGDRYRQILYYSQYDDNHEASNYSLSIPQSLT